MFQLDLRVGKAGYIQYIQLAYASHSSSFHIYIHGTCPCFSAIFTKGNNYYDLLFASVDNEACLEWELLYPLYTGGLFHCYMMDEAICNVRGGGSILLFLFYI